MIIEMEIMFIMIMIRIKIIVCVTSTGLDALKELVTLYHKRSPKGIWLTRRHRHELVKETNPEYFMLEKYFGKLSKCFFCTIRNYNLQTCKTPLESLAEGTSLFMKMVKCDDDRKHEI